MTLFDLMETSMKNFQLQTSSSLYSQDQTRVTVLENFSTVLSDLLHSSQLPSWLHLTRVEFEFLRTRYVRLLQELGTGLLETVAPSRAEMITRNFGESTSQRRGKFRKCSGDT